MLNNITNAKKLLLIFEYSKTAQKIQCTVSTQAVGKINDLCKILTTVNDLFTALPQYQIRKMIKLQRSCTSFVKQMQVNVKHNVYKWLLIPSKINYTILKLMFKGIPNERVPSNLHTGIKNNKQKFNKSTESLKLILINDPNYSSESPEYTTKMHSEVLKLFVAKCNIYIYKIMFKIMFVVASVVATNKQKHASYFWRYSFHLLIS